MLQILLNLNLNLNLLNLNLLNLNFLQKTIYSKDTNFGPSESTYDPGPY